jgi:hypothetical protein
MSVPSSRVYFSKKGYIDWLMTSIKLRSQIAQLGGALNGMLAKIVSIRTNPFKLGLVNKSPFYRFF